MSEPKVSTRGDVILTWLVQAMMAVKKIINQGLHRGAIKEQVIHKENPRTTDSSRGVDQANKSCIKPAASCNEKVNT